MYTAQQAYELVLLMIAIYREARGEPDEAKVAVGWVIRNRTQKPGKTWYGDSWIEVILKPYQFSSFNAHDPNATKLPAANDPSLWPCMMAAKKVYDGTAPDPTFGSTYYHDISIEAPDWAKTMIPTVNIGKLKFFREA